MSEIIMLNTYNERDPRFIKIRDEFYQELKKNFACDNYDEIIKYVFEEVFKNKLQKSACITEFESLFSEKTEELVNLLFKLAEQHLKEPEEKQEKDKDVLDKILSNEHKRSFQKNERSFQKRRKSSRDYYIPGKDRNDRHYSSNLGRKGRGPNRIKIGNKEVIIHNQRKRSRSRSNSDVEKNRYSKYDDYQGYNDQPYQRGFYPQPQPRMYQSPMMRGRFPPYFQPMMGYMDMRR